MSEFTGECYHLVHSDGWCEECKKKVHIIFHNDSDLVAEEQDLYYLKIEMNDEKTN